MSGASESVEMSGANDFCSFIMLMCSMHQLIVFISVVMMVLRNGAHVWNFKSGVHDGVHGCCSWEKLSLMQGEEVK